MKPPIEVFADEVRAGDKISCQDGSFVPVARIGRANWIKTTDGPCLEFFEKHSDRFGFIIGRKDIVAVQRA